MKRFILSLVMSVSVLAALAQGSVRGRILDKQTDEVMQFVNVAVLTPQGKVVKGGITDATGQFNIGGLADGRYTLQVSFVGYKTLTRQFTLTPQHRREHYNLLYLGEDATMLKEVQVTGQRSQMKLEVDRKVFSVDQMLAAAGGSASDLLEQIPSIEVTTDGEISLRGNSSVEVWINGKASGLTTDNRAEILQQIPAESIERIEVIDNPSAKFSPEGSAGIINIILKRDRKAGYYGSLRAGVNKYGAGTRVPTSTTRAACSTPTATWASVAVRTREAARVSRYTSRPICMRTTRARVRTRGATSLPASA